MREEEIKKMLSQGKKDFSFSINDANLMISCRFSVGQEPGL